MTERNITMTWDSDATVWVATSDNIPGLVLESGSFDALIERVKHAVPELLELNDVKQGDRFRICFKVERYDVLTA
jgi:hypothetical protein